MNSPPTLAKQLGGYLWAIPVWCLGVALSSFEADGLPREVATTVFFLGCLVVVVVTFGWGRLRGFPIALGAGRYSGTNLVRCLVMSGIMLVPVGMAALPLAYLVARFFG